MTDKLPYLCARSECITKIFDQSFQTQNRLVQNIKFSKINLRDVFTNDKTIENSKNSLKSLK